jgi:Flp pilus assembly protein TadG
VAAATLELSASQRRTLSGFEEKIHSDRRNLTSRTSGSDKSDMVNRKARQGGATLLLVTFVSTFVLMPIIGTCMDGAILFWVKARLQAAVDATALATARSLNVGQTTASQETNAEQLGIQYFTANFPTGVMRTTLVGGAPTITINETVVHKRIVNVNASVTLPTFFMRIIGVNSSTVSASGQATRRDANVMLVLDRSNSMNQNGSCAALVSVAQNFVSQFVDGRDQLGLVTFQTGANLDYAPTLTFKSGSPSLNSVLATLQCAGDTSTAQGMYLAYNQIKTVINEPGALNVILLFTDGEPNGLVANFNIKTKTDTRYDATNTSSLVSTPPSGCNASDSLSGVISDGSAETASTVTALNQTGYTVAVLSSAGVPISNTSNPTTINAAGCAFPNSDWTYSIYGRQDIAAIPTQDAYGNSTVDGGYMALDYFPTGDAYAGLIRPDMPRTTRWASFNAADSMAQTIRNDTTYAPVIYTIGLQGNEPMAIDQDFMERLANASGASNFDATKPQGDFILATSTAGLAQAFQQIASQILRLSR